MNKKNKKAFGVFVVILMITLGVIAAYYILLQEDRTSQPTYKDVSNKIINNTIENKIEETVNETVENEIEETVNETISNVIEGNAEENIKKAIEIVKKDWGEDDTVYFDNAGIDNEGRYIISVHNEETTETLAWYTVNIKTEQFFKQ